MTFLETSSLDNYHEFEASQYNDTCILVHEYPVVIISWVRYLGPPGPFSFPDSRDLLEVLGGLSWQRERPLGRIP